MDTKKSKFKKILAIFVLLILLVSIIPMIILFSEPNMTYSRYYYYLAHQYQQEGESDKAVEAFNKAFKYASPLKLDCEGMLFCPYYKFFSIAVSRELEKKVFPIFDSIRYIQNKLIANFYTPSENIPIYKIEISDKNYQKLVKDLP